MGHHIDSEGRFQSNKHSDLAPDKIILSFKDKSARKALAVFSVRTKDEELGKDVWERLLTIQREEINKIKEENNK